MEVPKIRAPMVAAFRDWSRRHGL